MLHNEAYKGDTLHQKHYTTDTLPFMVYHNEGQFPKYCAYKSHVAIVSDEDFDKVQQLLKTKQMSVPNAAPRVFTKKIYCAECGKPKPARVPQYKCDKCGWEPEDPHHPPKFCPECGDPFDDGDIKK